MANFITRWWNRTPKVVEVPTDERVELEGLETWCVQWASRRGSFEHAWHLTDCPMVVQAFTNEEDAKLFEKALRDAFAMVRDTITPHSIRRFKM